MRVHFVFFSSLLNFEFATKYTREIATFPGVTCQIRLNSLSIEES